MEHEMLSKILSTKHNMNYRRKGNQCRDARDWPGAVAAYTQHLVENNADQPIWVQLGHAWKEQGQLEEALKAYQGAVDLDIDDADANSHLADILLRLGRDEEALAAYQRLNAVVPSVEAIRNIRLLQNDSRATSVLELGEGTVFFAIQDLFGYLKAHVTMSGIQRVQAGIALHAIKDSDVSVRFILSHVAHNTEPLPAGEFWMVDNKIMQKVIEYASGEHVDHETLRSMLNACEIAAERVRALKGSTVILLGAFWGLGNSIKHFVHSKRQGVRIGAYVYDIIPVTHPEFCDDALVTDFTMAICELCATADFILTISDATKIALEEFIAENGGRQVPMVTVPLAHHLTRETDDSVAWPEQLKRVQGKRYVAYVSTIEGRKNHLYVVNIWRRLIAEGINVPDLVFVGRHGWKIGPLTDVLKATNNLDGKFHIAHNLSDGELNAVYANCEFSVFTSFVEGWGLPVGESLFHGRPCIASNNSSIPEVGGNLVDYVDPYNMQQGLKVFKKVITDSAYLQDRVDEISKKFVARTWSDVGADFLSKVKMLQDSAVMPLESRLNEGEVHNFSVRFGDLVNIRRYFKKPKRIMVESDFFYEAEDHGVWLRGASPEISIPTNVGHNIDVLVYFNISVAPGALDCRLTVFDKTSRDETSTVAVRDVRHGEIIRLLAKTDDEGTLHLRFNITGPYSAVLNDMRDFAIGLRSIGIAQVGNVAARQNLTESMNLFDLAN